MSCHHDLPQGHTAPASTWILPQSDTYFLLMISVLACRNTHSIILFSVHFQTELEACPAALRSWFKAYYEHEQKVYLQIKWSLLVAGALKNCLMSLLAEYTIYSLILPWIAAEKKRQQSVLGFEGIWLWLFSGHSAFQAIAFFLGSKLHSWFHLRQSNFLHSGQLLLHYTDANIE